MSQPTYVRITIANTEPGFSDARVLVKERKGKIRLTGGNAHDIVLKEGDRVEITALKRTGSLI